MWGWGVLVFGVYDWEHVMKGTCIIAVTLLAFCQSALANSVFYCVPKTRVGMTENGAVSAQLPRFTMKIGASLEGRFVQVKNAMFFDLSGEPKEYRIADYINDKNWYAISPALNTALSTYVIHFEFPNFFASHTNSRYGALLHATCETF